MAELIAKYSPLMIKGLDTLVGGHTNTIDSLDSLAVQAQLQLESLDQALLEAASD